jgi:hypothetical protein
MNKKNGRADELMLDRVQLHGEVLGETGEVLRPRGLSAAGLSGAALLAMLAGGVHVGFWVFLGFFQAGLGNQKKGALGWLPRGRNRRVAESILAFYKLQCRVV